MTHEEAIKIIESYEINGCGYCHTGGDEVEEAFRMAIEALKETDMGLNNGDHLHPFGEPFGWTEEEIQKHGLRELLKDMPYAQPEKSTTAEKSQFAEEKSTCDLISRQDAQKITAEVLSGYITDDVREVVETIDAEIGELPYAQPERKKGEWILVNGKTSINCSYCYHCSWSLSFEDTVRQFNFCPNCGADMRGEQDDS